jgi:hypothetical protein
MASPDFSGGNGESAMLEPCNSADELQYWALG